MKKLLFILILCFSTILCFGADYYVDATDGSDANNGSTVALAFATIQTCAGNMNPGDTCYVLSGVYSVSSADVVIVPATGTSGNPITYIAYDSDGTGDEPADEPIIQPMSGYIGFNFTIGYDYITIDGFIINGGEIGISSDLGTGNASTNVIIQNCHFSGQDRYGIYARPVDWLVDSNTFNDCGYRNIGFWEPKNSGQFDSGTTTISNNNFEVSAFEDHLYLAGYNYVVEYNEFHGADGGSSAGNCIQMDWGENRIVRYNTFEDTEDFDIDDKGCGLDDDGDGTLNHEDLNDYCSGGTGCPCLDTTYIYGNLFDGTDVSIRLRGGTAEIYNNTFIDQAANYSIKTHTERSWTEKANVKVYNNIFYNGTANELDDSAPETADVDYNTYYKHGTLDANEDSGSNSIYNRDPLFTSVDDDYYTLSSSSSESDSGSDDWDGTYNNDLVSTATPQNAVYDRGCYEYIAASSPSTPSIATVIINSTGDLQFGGSDYSCADTHEETLVVIENQYRIKFYTETYGAIEAPTASLVTFKPGLYYAKIMYKSDKNAYSSWSAYKSFTVTITPKGVFGVE